MYTPPPFPQQQQCAREVVGDRARPAGSDRRDRPETTDLDGYVRTRDPRSTTWTATGTTISYHRSKLRALYDVPRTHAAALNTSGDMIDHCVQKQKHCKVYVRAPPLSSVHTNVRVVVPTYRPLHVPVRTRSKRSSLYHACICVREICFTHDHWCVRSSQLAIATRSTTTVGTRAGRAGPYPSPVATINNMQYSRSNMCSALSPIIAVPRSHVRTYRILPYRRIPWVTRSDAYDNTTYTPLLRATKTSENHLQTPEMSVTVRHCPCVAHCARTWTRA